MRRFILITLALCLLLPGLSWADTQFTSRILPPISESPQAGAIPKADADGDIDAWITGSTSDDQNASEVNASSLGTPTYYTVQDWINNTQSAGVISGGGFADNGNGTLTVAAGTGFIKTTDNVIGITKSFDWPEDASVTPPDDDLSYVYVVSDGTINTTTIYAGINDHTEIVLGRVYRDGTELHFLESAHRVYDLMHRVRRRFYAPGAAGVRSDGMATTQEDGGAKDLCLDVTAGKFFWGLDRFYTPAFDSSGADTFSTWYYDGVWQETKGETEIDNQQYNDYGTGLAALGNNQYGVHWVFIHDDGGIHVVYGVDEYDLRDAYIAPVPDDIPDKVRKIGIFIAMIIIEEDEEGSFTRTTYPWSAQIEQSIVTDHGALGGLSDDDHAGVYEPAITWSTKSTDYTASVGDYLIIEDDVIVTGPASASEGDMITIACGGDWGTTNSEFDPNGLNIMGNAANFTMDTNMGFSLVYSSNATWGWAIY